MLSAIKSCLNALSFNPHQVCELDIIFNFEKAYFILDEFLMGGEIQETSKKSSVKAIEDADMLQEVRRKNKRRFLGFFFYCFAVQNLLF